MHKEISPALIDYIESFRSPDGPFLYYYNFDENKNILRRSITRENFWLTARKAAHIIRQRGCVPGDCFVHCFGANHPQDLAFRLGAVITGTTPVTINWQADTLRRIIYKINLSEARLVLADSHFDPVFLDGIKEENPEISLFYVDDLESVHPLNETEFCTETDQDWTRIIVFTSGTTDQPKGVELPYRSYRTNRSTFEQFLEIHPDDNLAVLIVNPMHHTNSTAITDWALRRPGSHIHLVERYSNMYWDILIQAAARNHDRLVAPTVSKHFDFLDTLVRKKELSTDFETLKKAMRKTDFLIGSAPVGPSTIERLRRYAGRTPHVRFGSTETCLQAIGTPAYLSEKTKLKTFQRGWNHKALGKNQPGYYIGRPHPPHTEARIVKNTKPGEKDFMQDCHPGQDGYLVVRGNNIMSGYKNNPEATQQVFYEGWYTGLNDICFTLCNHEDGGLDYYWVSRESNILIRGGANYAYSQINDELIDFVSEQYHLERSSFDLAVVGLKVASEHEDSCCVTIELKDDRALEKGPEMEKTFINLASTHVSKGSKPDYVRLAAIPRNFKGVVIEKDLAADYRKWLDLQKKRDQEKFVGGSQG